MLEGLVVWVLNNYLGKYVENLNTDQLSVALLSGKVELENLPLRKDALRHLGLPVEVKAGFIGKVQLQVPVRQIRSAPWIISIEKLYVVVSPVNLEEWDSVTEANIAHERKVSLLDGLEAQWRAEHEAQDSGYYATSYSSWLSYGTGLLANIVENLQLKLKDVHIRYEDAVTGGETEAFACGLTIESLSAESCDSDWVRGFRLLSDKDTCSYKLMELHKMAIYFDHIVLPSGLLANLTLAELAVRMGASETQHTYILSPSSAVAHVRRERSEQPLRSRTRPRFHCCLTLDNVSLNLTDRQYKSAVVCVRGLRELSVRRSCCALRPAPASPRRDWWIYAVKTHLPHHVWMDPRPTWDSCLARARQIRAYVDVMVWMLSNPASTLPPQKKAIKDELEWNWPLHLIKPLREIAMRRVPRSTPAASPSGTSGTSGAGRSMLLYWFPQWWGWYGSPDTSSPDHTPDLEEEILDVIADSLDNNTLLKRDTVFGQFEFQLNSGCLNLNVAQLNGESNVSSPRVSLQFSSVHVTVESRPRAGAVSLTVRVGDVMLRDRLTPRTLYPVLVAPQGMIREGLSALTPMSPPISVSTCGPRGRTSGVGSGAPPEPLLLLTYHSEPCGPGCDYRLYVKSQSLEVVYNSDVVQWVSEFFLARDRSGPAHASPPPLYQSVRDSTRMRILTHWDQLLQGQQNERSSWHIELDISAPQILLVEDFTDREAAVMLVDFGKMRLTHADQEHHTPIDDEELFMTPCSTPPASRESPPSPRSPRTPLSACSPPPPPLALDHAELHKRLYDTYSIELSDLQVLVGRARDNWKYAHTKTTSSLHLLDRFTISLQAELRAVHTSDPQFPSATLCGALPALVVHLSDRNVRAVRAVLAAYHSPSEEQTRSAPEAEDTRSECSEDEHTDRSQQHTSSLIMLQFDVEQMSLEVQSRGRCIAEVQVMGVRLGAALRPREVALALSVHSLLLVDALQTCGPDYELLVASHRHVGMDAASGSMLGSEPTSPTSPASPTAPHPAPHPAPLALASALSSLAARPVNVWDHARKTSGSTSRTPPSSQWGWGAGGMVGMVDSEALIAVEYCYVRGEGDAADDVRIANIMFNNLDIIANQETIVELIGFTQRITNPSSKKVPPQSSIDTTSSLLAMTGSEEGGGGVRTEITFDFHRLGVLVVRAASHDGSARKVATATLSEAKIQATLDKEKVSVRGSLGGLQVVNQQDPPGPHSRVVAAGVAAEVGHPGLHTDPYRNDHHQAMSFTVLRTFTNDTQTDEDKGVVRVVARVQVASVRYTHTPRLLAELRSCAADFSRYLANLARSIRNAAHDMAVGLVLPARVEAQSGGVSPRRRTTSITTSLDNESLADCLKSDTVVLSISVEVESPVVVLPLGAHSPSVFVAQLGRMSLANTKDNRTYRLHLTDISIYTLEVRDSFPSSAELASVLATHGRPVLHDTALHLNLHFADICEITGKIVGALRVSSTREQYEQLLETLRFMGEESGGARGEGDHVTDTRSHADYMDDGVDEVEGPEVGPAVTLRLDPQLRAQTVVPPPEPAVQTSSTAVKVNFQLPTFTVELRGDLGGGERSLVELSFQEFQVQYDRLQPHETSVEVSLHSVTMEDLTKDVDSKHRMLMMSHTPQPPKAVFVSKSCPDFITHFPNETLTNLWSKTSLPSQLNTSDKEENGRMGDRCGATPPCSPECGVGGNVEEEDDEGLSGDQNLVCISVHMRDSQHPLFEEKFNKVSRFVKVDFNCLNLLVSIDSWVVVLDFFGVAADDDKDDACPDDNTAYSPSGGEGPVWEMAVRARALGVVLVSRAGFLARAHASRLALNGGPSTPTGLRGTLGLVLTDLTPGPWRTRLSTNDPLTLHYQRFSQAEAMTRGFTSSLSVSCGAVRYVHTKRFVAQLTAFFADFQQLRRVLREARRKVSVVSGRARRARLQLQCSAVLVLPVSARSRHALYAAVTDLRSDNVYRHVGDPGTITRPADTDTPCRTLLDVRSVVLEDAELYCVVGPSCERRGPPLLTSCTLTLQVERNADITNNVPDMTVHGSLASLECAIDRTQYAVLRGVLAHNLGDHVPASNAPHPAHRSQPSTKPTESTETAVWKQTSLHLDLQNVLVRLEPEHGASSLACINFIRSRLMLETYSDLSQDIDLVSQEIVISDTRYTNEPANRRGNVFTVIAAPLPAAPHTQHGTQHMTQHATQHATQHTVQAEVHARRRPHAAAYTVLVNSMRLMLVLDWWQQAKDFLTQPPKSSCEEETPRSYHPDGKRNVTSTSAEEQDSMELKINITESQLVFVEDASAWDTNAVILKSTTVLSYRSTEARPLSCSLSGVEVVSCILGLEDDTATTIVSPADLHADLHADGTLHVQMDTLDLQLSYHDMRMFAAMLKSLRAQTQTTPTESVSMPANSAFMSVGARALTDMGFSSGDARHALQECSGRVNDAALWLSTHAQVVPAPSPVPAPPLWPLRALQVRAECVTLCVIDDCLDSDVPLLELCLKQLLLDQDLRRVEEALDEPPLAVSGAPCEVLQVPCGPPHVPLSPGGGALGATLEVLYYNRMLSGWEPGIEPWRFSSSWEYQMSADLRLRHLQLDVRSDAVLDLNVTSELMKLLKRAKDLWAGKQHSGVELSPKSSPAGHRRRSPFVPYALRNNTGHKLWFTTITTDLQQVSELEPELEPVVEWDPSWVVVRAGDTAAFSFGRARDHAARSHQVALRVDGWQTVGPVSVDRVGHYYRRARHLKSSAVVPIVMEVSLEGSARKLVTVRSAVLLRNKLPHALEVRVDHAPAAVTEVLKSFRSLQRRPFPAPAPAPAPRLPHTSVLSCYYNPCVLLAFGSWGVSSSRTVRVGAGGVWSAPLSAARCPLWCRPLAAPEVFLFCDGPLPTPGPPPPPAHPRTEHLHYCRCHSTADHVYRFCCVAVQQAFPTEGMWGLTLTLVPALRIQNLLPLELQYRVWDRDQSVRATGTVPPHHTQPTHQVNMEEGVEISVKLDGFGWSTPLSILPSATTSFSARVKLLDRRARRLYLNTRTHIGRTDAIEVSVSAAYWLVNRTGLPLVFRAEGASEAAGQGAEHEAARVVQPLPFCFAEPEAAPTLQVRLGRGLYTGAEWCAPFGLGPGTCSKQLEARGVAGGVGVAGGAGVAGGEGVVLEVGVATRAGRGRYRHTNIVTLCPRYQIHNNTPYTLHLAQKWAATSLKDPGAAASVLSAAPGCYLPWQWSRWEREQLLAVRLPQGSWSGAFRVARPRTTHVLCRRGTESVCVRVEVVCEGAAVFVVLSDADSGPPPLRLRNYSDVALMYHQVGCTEESVVGAHSAVDSALPEPERASALAVRAPGGARVHLHLAPPAPSASASPPVPLRYQNFLYVAFPGTSAPSECQDECLVLEVPIGTNKVVLARKRYGDRSQLWRLGPGQQLIHEGSSPPQNDARLYDAPITPHDLVLDIEGPAPRPGARTALCLRRADPRRASTQSWSLRRGAMTCAHHTLSVQPDPDGKGVVLGLAGLGGVGGVSGSAGVVEWHRLRPGSGRLLVAVTHDGPTTVVTVTDEEAQDGGYLTGASESVSEVSSTVGGVSEWGVRVCVRGVGVSLVAGVELAYVVVQDVTAVAHAGRLSLTARDLSADDQLFDSPHPVFVYCLRSGEEESGLGVVPALQVDIHSSRAPPVWFPHVVVCVRPLAVRLEERLVLMLWRWVSGGRTADSAAPDLAGEEEAHRVLADLTAVTSQRYYFRTIRVAPTHIRLSMACAGKLDRELSDLKRRLGLTLVGFEDAAVELQPFIRDHQFDTVPHLAREMVQHFKDQLKWQAAKILGSVDFLGNPLGFVSDVSEGVSGLINNGSVGALLQNITHGISNSAAKVSESLGDGLERVVVDEAHEETRRRLRGARGGGPGPGDRSHLAAGLRGLGLGLLGGLTSLVKHTYEGAAAEGVAGFVSGVGKGLVGTVTKPVIGVLDLAAEAAAAVRDRARADRMLPQRKRPPRQVCAGSLLAPYCPVLAEGAGVLARLSPGDALLAYGEVRAPPHAVTALVSARHVRVLTGGATALQAALGDVRGVAARGDLLELRLSGGAGAGAGAGERRPRVRCDTPGRAAWLARTVAAAVAHHRHHAHRLPTPDNDT